MRIHSLLLSLLMLSAPVLSSAQTSTQNESATPASKLYPAGLVALSNEELFAPYCFVVDKSKRELSVYQWKDNDLVKIADYPTDIGKNVGDKTKANDARTPVGIYFLQRQMTQPEIPFDIYGALAFSTDYPNIFDRRDAKTGSGIWLHAVPDTVPLTRGSRGCVVVRNNVIKILKDYVKLQQTPILIYDEVKYLNDAEYQIQRKKFLQDFENWRMAWETQDVDTYIKYYDETFRNDQMNYKQWYKHKKHLKELYTYIKVQLSPPVILQNKDQIVIRTIQRYESNLHKDYGEKTIHARLDPNVGFRIIREDWKPLVDPQTSTQAAAAPAKAIQRQQSSQPTAAPTDASSTLIDAPQ